MNFLLLLPNLTLNDSSTILTYYMTSWIMTVRIFSITRFFLLDIHV
jgi:hypothetical protein